MAISFPSTSPTPVVQNVGADLRPTPPQVQSQVASPAPQPAAPAAPAQPSTAAAQGPSAAATPSSEELKKAIDAINRRLDESSRNLQFSLDHDSGKMIVRVVDTATNEVIRQIPSEVALAISQSLEKLQGLLLKQRA
jgi:flagellar protein FlaG